MSPVWTITTHFNPLRTTSRLRNHRRFRASVPTPLLTVEWDRDGDFELTPADADVLVQVRGGDLLWQKERLLNVALSHLPAEADAVAWVDGAVVLTDPAWPARALAALQDVAVLQPFDHAHYLDPAATAALVDGAAVAEVLAAQDPARATPASARLLAGVGADALVADDVAGHATLDIPVQATRLPRIPGLAWVARRSLLERVGWWDRAITGSGDWLWMLAAMGRAEPWLAQVADRGYGYLAASSYPAWAAQVASEVDGAIGHLDGAALHLHHGRLADRGYKVRHGRLAATGVDLEADLVLDEGGAWKVVGPRRTAVLDVLDGYFRTRDEDHGLVAVGP